MARSAQFLLGQGQRKWDMGKAIVSGTCLRRFRLGATGNTRFSPTCDGVTVKELMRTDAHALKACAVRQVQSMTLRRIVSETD